MVACWFAQTVRVQSGTHVFSALLRFSYFDGRHGCVCGCVPINGIAVCKAVGTGSALTLAAQGIYRYRARRHCDVVCERESDVKKDLVESAVRYVCMAVRVRSSSRNNTVICVER